MKTRSFCHELCNNNQAISFWTSFPSALLLAARNFIPLRKLFLSIFEAIFSVFLQLFLEGFFFFIKLESHDFPEKSCIGFLINHVMSNIGTNMYNVGQKFKIYLFFIFIYLFIYFSPLMDNHTTSSQLYYKYL